MSYRGLFEKIENSERSKVKNYISMEMIEPQINDPVVEELSREFENIINSNIEKANYFKENKNPEYKKYTDNIDKIIKKRFGITIKHIYARNCFYACLPIKPLKNSILDRDFIQVYESVKGYLYRFDKSKKDKKKDHELGYDHDTPENNNEIYRNFIKYIDSLTDYLKKGSVSVDLNKAKINNLPEDYVCYVLTDPYLLIKIFKYTARELTAVLLHEIGHVFTHIEYSTRIARTTQVLSDTVKEKILKNNNTTKKNLKIIYESVFGKPLDKKFEDKTDIQTAIYIMEESTQLAIEKKLSLDISPQDHSFTDSEQLADEFASRFLLGKELISGLRKLSGESFINNFRYYLYNLETTFFIVSITIASRCAMQGGLLGILAIPITLIVYVLFSLISFVFLVLFRKRYTKREKVSGGMTYDDARRRLIRIRNEMIRQLSNIEDKDVKQYLLDNIKLLDMHINSVGESHFGLIEKIKINFTNDGRIKLETKRVEQILEDLYANDLHVSAAKLEKLKAKK